MLGITPGPCLRPLSTPQEQGSGKGHGRARNPAGGHVEEPNPCPPGRGPNQVTARPWPAGDPGEAVRDPEQSAEEVQAAREARRPLAHASLPEGWCP